MADSRRTDDPERLGGKPVGRLATEGPGRSSPPTPRAWPGALPLIILALVVGLGGGVAIGWFVGQAGQEASAATNGASTTNGPTTTAATTTTADTAGAYGVVTFSGTALPAFTSGQADTGLGLAVPQVSGTDFAGNPHVISANGKGKLIVALAHWCPYCQQELPVLVDWYDSTNLPDEVEVFLLTVFTTPERSNFPPGPWLTGAAWSGPVLVDDAAGSLAYALGITSVPYNLIVAPDGTVAARVTGGLSADQLNGAIDYLADWEPSTTTP